MAGRRDTPPAEPDEFGVTGFGRTLRDVSIEQRIETAKKALRESDKTTREIRERAERGRKDR